MKRKTYVLVISANNPVKKRARAGFKFTADPRAVMVTLDRKLALEQDSDLKVYKPKSDHYARATGKVDLPNSINKKMNDALRKLHTTVIADPDYMRSEDSIRNELEMMGEEGMEAVAKDIGAKVGKDENMQDVLTAALLQLEAEPAEIIPADPLPEEDEEEETDEDEEEDEDAIDEEAVLERFKELDGMSPDDLTSTLEKAGYEDEGDKTGKILAILTEEFGEGVEDLELPEVTDDSVEDDEEATEEAAKAPKSAPKTAKATKSPPAKKNAPTAKKKAPAKAAKKK